MTIHIEQETTVTFDFDIKEVIEQVIIGTLDYENCPYEAEITVILMDNPSIQEVNMEQRGIAAPTDVLSFPMLEFEKPSEFSKVEEEQADSFHPDSGELMLGEILLSLDKVRSQAVEYGHSNKRELGFLIAHSMLHLCGYDHMEEEERSVMEEHQSEILKRLSINR